MSFRARFAGTCGHCAKPIAPNQMIHKGDHGYVHAAGCSSNRVAPIDLEPPGERPLKISRRRAELIEFPLGTLYRREKSRRT